MLDGGNHSRDPGGPDLERFVFWRGQHLESRDLNDLGAGEEERLFWHNRAVHDAYGIVAGLTVDASRPPGVAVQPGLAYDAYGRELALYEPVTLRRPAEAGSATDPKQEVWALLLRYRQPDPHHGGGGDVGAHAARGCGCGDTNTQRSELVWRRARQVRIKDGVVLARSRWISRAATEWLFLPDPDFHPLRARPLARPVLGRGATPQGVTAWRPWSQLLGPASAAGEGAPPAAHGIEVTVDTSGAGFTDVPCYFAWLQGALWEVPWRLVRTLPLDRITFAARDRFTYNLWDPATSTPADGQTTVEAQAAPRVDPAALLNVARQRLYVCWLGIQTSSASLVVHKPALGRQALDTGPR